ncbi:MAG: hypothetical protein KatS3mg124_0317 [Porticoccaceae bacterium]|nr:MAG: hypothetical protein KatS3mg124_0317 [Porticoccaceae bacterium]
MECNLGKWDRWLRAVLGLAIIGWGVYAESWWGLLGVVLLLSAAVGFCPVYRLLGFSTCKGADAGG